MGISFSNNWDTWAGINQCVVVTIWQRTIEDRDQDCQCANNPLLARAVPGEEDPGPLGLSLSLALTSRGRGPQLFILKWSGKCTALLVFTYPYEFDKKGQNIFSFFYEIICPLTPTWILYPVLKGSVSCQILCQNKKSLLIPWFHPCRTDGSSPLWLYILSLYSQTQYNPWTFQFPNIKICKLQCPYQTEWSLAI